ncbi:MAG TPA: hypothetical protein VKY85_28735 [Candidatus Angelobacter sp.]|nr:hypothetical protein [Candidatus Angelobacter sp.]
MRTDTYTKIVLTIIAVMLTLIACNTVVNPEKTASAEGPFAGVSFTMSSGIWTFFNSKTGEVWVYKDHSPGRVYLDAKYKLVKLGDPLVWENPPK